MNRYDKAVLSVTSVVVDENLALAVVDRLVADEVIPLDINELLAWWGTFKGAM
jgi:hypothetical protein